MTLPGPAEERHAGIRIECVVRVGAVTTGESWGVAAAAGAVRATRGASTARRVRYGRRETRLTGLLAVDELLGDLGTECAILVASHILVRLLETSGYLDPTHKLHDFRCHGQVFPGEPLAHRFANECPSQGFRNPLLDLLPRQWRLATTSLFELFGLASAKPRC